MRRADRAEPKATDDLFALLYEELRRMADRHLRGGTALTLGTTTLVHETYLNMAGRPGDAFPDRGRFFAYASRAMRGLVIDYARRHGAKKRDRGFEITLVEDVAPAGDGRASDDLEALDAALHTWPSSMRGWRSWWTCTSSGASPSSRSPSFEACRSGRCNGTGERPGSSFTGR